MYESRAVGKELGGFVERVDDWDALGDALAARGHGRGAVYHLDELDAPGGVGMTCEHCGSVAVELDDDTDSNVLTALEQLDSAVTNAVADGRLSAGAGTF